jgi:hypothetical protein
MFRRCGRVETLRSTKQMCLWLEGAEEPGVREEAWVPEFFWIQGVKAH